MTATHVNKSNAEGPLIITLVVLGIICLALWSSIDSKSHQIDDLNSKIDDVTAQADSYQSALDTANSTIEDMNSNIEDAQGAAGSTYDDMWNALDSLETGDTVTP
jgi:hypothetical protein